jgi:hypothetical protein
VQDSPKTFAPPHHLFLKCVLEAKILEMDELDVFGLFLANFRASSHYLVCFLFKIKKTL